MQILVFIILLLFITVSVGLAWYLLSRDKGEKEPTAALWLAVSFGLAGGLLATWLEGRFIPTESFSLGSSTLLILASAMGIGMIEELCKFLPLALFIYKKRYFNEHTDGIIYFALAGLAMGLPENLLYTLQLGPQAGLTRLIMTPLFQAAATALVGYCLVELKLAKQSAFGVIIPLAVMMLLHGIYDFGLLSGSAALSTVSLIISLGITAAMFLVFWRARREDQIKLPKRPAKRTFSQVAIHSAIRFR